MQESLITKKIIAYSLKKIMETTPFSKVSISQIMSEAGIRRQTFYNYFQDKYELLDWIYQQDISENISDFLDYEEWDKVVRRIIDYFHRNQQFYRNALQVSEQNAFDLSFYHHTKGLLEKIITDMTKDQSIQTPHSLECSTQFYSYAFVGITKEWLLAGCDKDPEVLADDIITVLIASIRGLLLTSQNKEDPFL